MLRVCYVIELKPYMQKQRMSKGTLCNIKNTIGHAAHTNIAPRSDICKISEFLKDNFTLATSKSAKFHDDDKVLD